MSPHPPSPPLPTAPPCHRERGESSPQRCTFLRTSLPSPGRSGREDGRGAGGEGPRFRTAAAFALLLLAATAAWATIDVKDSLTPEVVGIDEVATFSIEVRGGGFSQLSFKAPTFQPESLENLEVVAGPFTSESISFVNGNFSRTFKLSWELRARGVGRARVHAVSILLGDQRLDLPDREIQVQQQPTQPQADQEDEDPLDRFFGGHFPLRKLLEPPEAPSDAPRVFLRAEVTPERPVVGQQALYTVYLYSRDDVSAVNPRSLPTFKGFWVHDVPQPQNLPTEMVDLGGARYGRVVLLRRALFPLRPGPHAIEPTAFDVLVRTFERSFFGPALERPSEVELKTKPVVIEAQPLPPAPPGFLGAVGRMALAATLSPRTVRVGEAAALTLTLQGEGNLQGVTAPALHLGPGLKALPPQQEGNERLAGETVRGVRTWTYAVIPERAGRYEVAAAAIPFFDPAAHAYRNAAVPPLALTVEPPAAAAAATGGPASGAASARPGGGRTWKGLLPWLALPLAVALVVTLVRRQRPRPGSREAALRLLSRLREAEAESRPRQAAAHVEEAWREFLEVSWEVPAASPAIRWRELLSAKGAEPAAARELGELADDLQYLRQAPQLSAAGSLQAEAVARSRRLVRRL